MILRELLKCLNRVIVSGPTDLEIEKITTHSKDAGGNCLFAAIRGTTINGHDYIGDALKQGCRMILSEVAPPEELSSDVCWLHVGDSRLAVAQLSSELGAHPWKDMAMVGVTGTNGKTTTTYLLHHLMKSAWHRAGLLGTVTVDDGEKSEPAKHTTPGSIELTDLLGRMRDHGCRGVAMEVSSHGIHQQRVAGIGFDACVFTNLTQDHLDYHGTIEEYFKAKADWFRQVAADRKGKKGVAVINLDDAYGAELVEELQKVSKVVTYGHGVHCDFRANNLKQSARGMEFELTIKGGKSYLVRAPMIGRFNVYNILAAIAAADVCGIKPREAVAALASVPQVPGRMEYVGNAGGLNVFVDYAHTPDALMNACRTLKELNPRRLITVFGCGGDRDKGKRPLMAAAAHAYSDACVVTSDNPRSEDPQQIIEEIRVGFKGAGHLVMEDRSEAIAHAIHNALSGDIVLIAGKGHEKTQQFADHTIEFDDRKHASKALRDRAEYIAENR